jgi:hypothetical protein
MTNPTSLSRPQDLRPGQVVTTWPDGDLDPDRFNESGRWTVTRVHHYEQVTRVDWRDETGETGTWVLPHWAHLSVEMSDRELQAAAARVIADLAEQAPLPPIWEWRISEDGVSGQIGHCPSTKQALQEWADYLGATVTATPCDGYTYLSVQATVNGVSVEIWTHGPASPERA